MDGHHRLKVCAELGIKDYPKVIRAGMTEEEKRIHARKLNMARRHLTQEQRRELIREQLKETPEKSDRQIAAGLGVSNNTVSLTRKKLESNGELCESHSSIGVDGKERPRQVQRKPVSIFNPTKREERAIQNPAVVEKMEETGASPVHAAAQIAREEKAKLYHADSRRETETENTLLRRFKAPTRVFTLSVISHHFQGSKARVGRLMTARAVVL